MKYQILHELREHLPFTAAAAITAIFVIALIDKKIVAGFAEPSFYFLHSTHILFSAITPAAMFYKYRKNLVYAVVSALLIALIISSSSDIIFPYLGSIILGIPVSFHLALLEKPLLIIGIALTGALLGIYKNITKLPHFLHVFLSVFASLFYLLSFSIFFNTRSLFLIFLIIVVSVVVPCCLGDIILPIILKEKI